MTKRWTQQPEGATWGEFGEDDELGRINLLTPEKVLEGVREVEHGITFSLSLPLDYPGGNALHDRRHPPKINPITDMAMVEGNFYNAIARDTIDPSFIDVWSDDLVTLYTQYSTQWDSLAHQGQMFDVDGDGVEQPTYYNGFRGGVDIIGPKDDARGDGSGSTSWTKRLGLEHMAEHGVQGRGVLVDLHHHLGSDRTPVGLELLQEIMTKDDVVVEPGDMLVLNTGFAQQILDWEKKPDPVGIHTMYSHLDASDEALLDWIAESRISALIADNYAVEGFMPKNPEPHTLLPIHNLCLFKLGVPLGELWYTQKLAGWLRENGRSRFLLTAPPLNLPGTQGSPLTPVATV